MKRAFLCVLALLTLSGGVSCAQPVVSEMIQSEKPRITSPNVSADDRALLVDGNNAFVFDLYQALREENDNIFYSPYSISLALTMTYAGARGETAKQMADTLHYLISQEQLHPAFNSLDLELGKRGEGARGKDGEGFRLNIVNAIWGQEDYKFLAQFLDVLAENYGAGLRSLDFVNAPGQSRITINDWVSDNTEGRIEDLIPDGIINPATVLVLTNAIYFNAAWQYPFEDSWTIDGPFYLLNGDKVTVPMMRQKERFGYADGEDYQAVELPYDGGELSMVILLPQKGQFKAFEDTLDGQQIADIIENLRHQQVELTIPKFTYESKFMMKKILSRMGIRNAFLPEIADLSGIDGTQSLFIEEVIHQAFVEVDEAGTEAAAATAVVVTLTAAPGEPKEVTIDRPFIFMIRDIETGTILFVGRVLNPTT
jgi:serpin B